MSGNNDLFEEFLASFEQLISECIAMHIKVSEAVFDKALAWHTSHCAGEPKGHKECEEKFIKLFLSRMTHATAQLTDEIVPRTKTPPSRTKPTEN